MTLRILQSMNSVQDFDRVFKKQLFRYKSLSTRGTYILGRTMALVAAEQAFWVKREAPKAEAFLYDPSINFCEAVKKWYRLGQQNTWHGSAGFEDVLFAWAVQPIHPVSAVYNLRSYLFQECDRNHDEKRFYKNMIEYFHPETFPHVKLALIHEGLDFDGEMFGG